MDDLFSWVSFFQGRLYVEIRKWSRNYLWQVPSLCKNCSCIIDRLTWFRWLFCTLEVEKVPNEAYVLEHQCHCLVLSSGPELQGWKDRFIEKIFQFCSVRFFVVSKNFLENISTFRWFIGNEVMETWCGIFPHCFETLNSQHFRMGDFEIFRNLQYFRLALEKDQNLINWIKRQNLRSF